MKIIGLKQLAAGGALVVSLGGSAAAQIAQIPPGAQMPDPKQMSGVPLPTGDIPAGTVTVRVVRGSLSNLVTGHPVELIGDATASATTNDAGRAEFTGLKPGSRVKAVTVVDGERLESQEFTLPPQAGIRLMLVATDAGAARRAAEDQKLAQAPARTGIVVLGEQSRIVFELGDDGLTVFNIYQILNTARTPVQPAVPIVFHLPPAAGRASILEGSSPLAQVAGDRVNVNGPFPPGMTLVQFAYTLRYSGGSATVTHRLPAALAQLSVVVQKVGDMRFSSPQVAQQRDVTADGQSYILAQGPPLAAGTDVTFSFSGLPHAPVWPRNLALALACLILVIGAYAAVRGRHARGAGAERQRLIAERERLFAQLTVLEESHRIGTVDQEVYGMRRRELIVALERVYAALDEAVAA
ncbi:MAG TPA: hypothetical protein VJ813_21355 [Vicinamibacterales bacterium]|nr:hypothetical protein [Vicinamibacterales bacterium]